MSEGGGGGGGSGWVTPKNIVKKRRKSSIAKYHQSKSVTAQIASDNEQQQQQEVQKFNPFSSSQTKNTAKSSSNTNDPFAFGKTSKISEEKTGDFFNALSEQSGNITKGLEATNVTLSMEQKLHNRILKGQTASRRSRLPEVDEQPVCADDECARDGFSIQQRQPARMSVIPLDLSIKSQIRFKLRDTSNFKRIKTLDWSRACAQMAPETDAQLLTSSAIYYIWPTMLTEKVYPRFGGLGIGSARDFDATWAEFSKTLPAIFASLKFGLHHYFYVFHANFTVLILRTRTLTSDDSPNSTQTSMPGLKLRAIITPVSTGLREMLIKEGVIENTENNPSIFDPNNQKRAKLEPMMASTDRDHQPELDIDDDRSWDHLRAKNLIRFATKNLNNTKNHDGPQRLSSIVITEKAQVQALVNMLMKMHDSIDLPPTIISHMPFANATVRHLSVKTTTDTIQVSGPILPHHNYNLHHVVKATVKQQGQNGGYETEYTAERSTLGFNDLQQGETTSGTTNSSDTVNGWLSGNTFTYRQLAYRDGCYIH